jgi:calcineurin-like phosphoesterase family protein
MIDMIYFTSDLHFGHRNIIDYANRPFWDNKIVEKGGNVVLEKSAVDFMNESLIQNWNDIVGEDDTVYVLGDVAMGKIADSLPLVLKLNGNKFLIPGNHDRCHFMHSDKKRKGWKEKYEDVGFHILGNSVDDGCGVVPMSYQGYDFLLCHFPYVGDSQYDERYSAYRPDFNGQWLLHGHTHSDKVYEKSIHPRQIHVGIDAWNYHPVNITQIISVIEFIESQGVDEL